MCVLAWFGVHVIPKGPDPNPQGTRKYDGGIRALKQGEGVSPIPSTSSGQERLGPEEVFWAGSHGVRGLPKPLRTFQIFPEPSELLAAPD